MSKSKLRGIVGYTCYTRPSLQCTYLSSLKPGKTANEEGSFLPAAYRGRYERASTAPAGKTRTINSLMSTEIKEDSFKDIQRPNPKDAEWEMAKAKAEEAATRPMTSHWRSVAKESFKGIEGEPASPQSRERTDMPQVTKPETDSDKHKEPNVLELARGHALKKGNRPRPRTSGLTCGMRLGEPAIRPESREGQVLQRGRHRGGVMGTSQASRQLPGYSGFIPESQGNEHALSHGFGKDTRGSLKETLFDCYRKVVPGYTGFQPASVHNVRTFDVPLVTTHGAQNHSMLELHRELKRPEAGGESLILKEMFQAPLDGRPSDNGLTNAQTYYSCVRPYEGLPRVHYPSKTHMVGCKFASTSVANMEESGVNSPLKFNSSAA